MILSKLDENLFLVLVIYLVMGVSIVYDLKIIQLKHLNIYIIYVLHFRILVGYKQKKMFL